MNLELRAPGKLHATSWHEIHRDAETLAGRLAPHGPFQGLVVISRGGLVPGAIVARALGIVFVETVCISSYHRRSRGPLTIVKPAPPALGDGRGWLIIDDVADSGATAEEVRRMLPAAHFAALYAKPSGRPFVDTFIRDLPEDVWIDFPWDRRPAP